MNWIIAPASVEAPEARATVRAYIADIASRYYGRPATDREIDEALDEEPDTELVPPKGAFLLARDGDGGPVGGCSGTRLLDPATATAELKRVWVAPHARRQGLGSLLVEAAEDAARALGATAIRLDTRHDLVEARTLYAARGYAEIAPYNSGPYADHWFEKRL
ncbi:GNAT family N-acetyltransferase [Streptomyces sp. NPDC048172]|uniref:GNAT family N-acetyltransferase n=1 Tax=Streptomyces sp. NPDC048172 TaxID=3365505 RepID=UPI00371C1804